MFHVASACFMAYFRLTGDNHAFFLGWCYLEDKPVESEVSYGKLLGRRKTALEGDGGC